MKRAARRLTIFSAAVAVVAVTGASMTTLASAQSVLPNPADPGAPGLTSGQSATTATPVPSLRAREGDLQDGLGRETRAWLALQVSGKAAGPQQPMSGDETAAAYKRYTDSFTHPIPEFYQQKIRSDSSGGGS